MALRARVRHLGIDLNRNDSYCQWASAYGIAADGLRSLCVCAWCSASPLITNLQGESALDLAMKVKDRPALGDQNHVTVEVLQVQ